jgi:ubiquinone biosynthesis monooxygenase Coq7
MHRPVFTPVDQLCLGAETLLRGLFAQRIAGRPNPAAKLTESELSDDEKRHVAGLMRVNHVGEVCAQGLYLGQALTARQHDTREQLLKAAHEEADHLRWCQQRLQQLHARTSLLNPLWFGGAVLIGAGAGLFGDGWNLGFVVETERQVEAHLDGHLQQLPSQDHASRAIIEQMKNDEMAHANHALQQGAKKLPDAIKMAMKWSATVMTTSAYYV